MSGILKLSATALLVSVSAAGAQQRGASEDRIPWPPVHTFSILGYDSVTGEVGAAVQSRVFSVGNGVLWAEADVGVAATQAIVDVSYGPKALAYLKQGLAPADVIQRVLADDPDPRPDDWTKLGFPNFGTPIHVTCEDHNGHSAVYMQQWDGHKWVRVSDLIKPMTDKVEPMLQKAAADYVKKNTGWPKRTEPCDKSS